ncbi:MAG: hypothetical protein WBM83_12420 [Flavobacteriaceae bacterium]
MKRKVFSILTLLCLVCTMGYTQNAVEEISTRDVIERLGPENKIFRTLTNPVQANTQLVNTTSIFIEQVGSGNQASLFSKTESSHINLIQNGSANTVRTEITALNLLADITQKGDNHFLTEFSNTPLLNLERTINQNGNSQNLTIHGSNSLSEKMRVTMEGNTNTIVIRNFN